MSNIGRQGAAKKKILPIVVHSQGLHVAPVKLQEASERAHQTKCVRVCSAERTISADTANIVARIPPIELFMEERTVNYYCTTQHEHRLWKREACKTSEMGAHTINGRKK